MPLSELLSPPTPDFHRRAVPTCHHHKPLSRRCHPLIPSLIPSLDCHSRCRSRRFHLAPSAHHAVLLSLSHEPSSPLESSSVLLPLTVALTLLILTLLPALSSKHKMARTKLSVPRRCRKQLVKIANRRVVDASEEGGGDAFISWPLKRILKKDKESVRAKFRLVKQVHKELRASSRRHGTHRTSYFDGSHRNAVAKFVAQAVDFLDEPAFDPEKYDRASKNIVNRR